jgi:squalene-hopene/tetraprenyl-beta-curcumene cyclase
MTIEARSDLPAQRQSARAARPVVDLGVATALGRARDHLLGLQNPAGWWKGELQTNVTMDAEDLLLRQFLGIRTAAETAAAARWIRSQQRADGTWATFHGGPGELSTTVEAYVALRLAGDDPAEAHMARAGDWIREHGGVERTRVFTRIWLALFGWWSWDHLPVMPPEISLLPTWVPLNIYDWACWARQTVVPLTVVGTLRPRRDLGVDISEIFTGAPDQPRSPLLSWAGAFQRLDAVLHRYQRLPWHPLRATAVRKSLEWIVRRQESDGGWGGIQPPWVYGILALHLSGYPLDHPVLQRALAGLDGFTIWEDTPDGPIRRLEACQSPVWDTALAVIALDDAGVPPESDAQRRAARWLLAEEVTVSGDWAVQRPGLAPGGWAFEFANDNYPDVDDTAEVVLALRRLARIDPAVDPALARGLAWSTGMQSRDGGWAAFDADNTEILCTKLPFCDFGAVIDPPSADVTAHMVEMLSVERRAGSAAAADPGVLLAARRGIDWLLRAQEPDGSWFGRWGANYVYGTGAAVPALVEAGFGTDHPAIRAAVSWLLDRQNDDGGWGEDLRSYVDDAWRGRGASTASQTAWALLALIAAGEADAAATARGVDFLVRTQRADGTWDEPYFTGTGFPGDFYINYHLYRLVFPVMALGRYITARAGGVAEDAA